MTARGTLIEEFLARAGWSEATRQPLAGDASKRRYLRLKQDDATTAILMDADPRLDSTTPAFVAMTHWLFDHGLSAPEILAAEPEAGLLLLEDFGDASVSALCATQPDRQTEVYKTCIAALLRIRSLAPPALPCPDASTLAAWTSLADTHYPGADTARLLKFRAALETILANQSTHPPTLSLRDFHADNLIWLEQREGIRRLGLLDYQDAFLTHPVYDLVSLLTDARRDISAQMRRSMIAEYAAQSGDDIEQLGAAFAAFSCQRNMRILGIFARVAYQDGRAAYLRFLPRTHGYLVEALDHPIFDAHRESVLAALPAPAIEGVGS
jgi:N-acetylmuramate 1-kinase